MHSYLEAKAVLKLIIGAGEIGVTVGFASVIAASVIGTIFVDASVISASEIDATVIGDSVIGASVIGATVVDASVISASDIDATVIGDSVIGASVISATVVDDSMIGDSELDISEIRYASLLSVLELSDTGTAVLSISTSVVGDGTVKNIISRSHCLPVQFDGHIQ